METFVGIFVAMLFLGGPLIWAMALNLRDRREGRLLSTVLAELDGPELRGRLAATFILTDRAIEAHRRTQATERPAAPAAERAQKKAA